MFFHFSPRSFAWVFDEYIFYRVWKVFFLRMRVVHFVISKSLHSIVSSSWTGINSRLVDFEHCQRMRFAMLQHLSTIVQRWLDILLIRVDRHQRILDDNGLLLGWNRWTFEFATASFWQFCLVCNEFRLLKWCRFRTVLWLVHRFGTWSTVGRDRWLIATNESFDVLVGKAFDRRHVNVDRNRWRWQRWSRRGFLLLARFGFKVHFEIFHFAADSLRAFAALLSTFLQLVHHAWRLWRRCRELYVTRIVLDQILFTLTSHLIFAWGELDALSLRLFDWASRWCCGFTALLLAITWFWFLICIVRRRGSQEVAAIRWCWHMLFFDFLFCTLHRARMPRYLVFLVCKNATGTVIHWIIVDKAKLIRFRVIRSPRWVSRWNYSLIVITWAPRGVSRWQELADDASRVDTAPWTLTRHEDLSWSWRIFGFLLLGGGG